jgi:hypothetical protein
VPARDLDGFVEVGALEHVEAGDVRRPAGRPYPVPRALGAPEAEPQVPQCGGRVAGRLSPGYPASRRLGLRVGLLGL